MKERNRITVLACFHNANPTPPFLRLPRMAKTMAN